MPARLYDWAPRLETLPEVLAFTVVWMLAGAALTLGYRARLAAGVLCAMSIGLHVVDQNFWAHHVYFMTLVLLLLTIIDSDASLSLRWLREGRPERDVLWWPVWLVQVQLTLAYLFTAIAKLNPAFLDGAVLQTAIGASAGMGVAGAVDRPSRRLAPSSSSASPCGCRRCAHGRLARLRHCTGWSRS